MEPNPSLLACKVIPPPRGSRGLTGKLATHPELTLPMVETLPNPHCDTGFFFASPFRQLSQRD